MTEKHDVCADPLTPYWRAKVDRAGERVFREMGAYEDEHMRRRQERQTRKWTQNHKRPLPRGIKGREKLFASLWNAGVPGHAIADRLGLTSQRDASAGAAVLRLLGMSLEFRGPTWRPGEDWQERLDDLLDED